MFSSANFGAAKLLRHFLVTVFRRGAASLLDVTVKGKCQQGINQKPLYMWTRSTLCIIFKIPKITFVL